MGNEFWRAYLAPFAIEARHRVSKGALGLTAPGLRRPRGKQPNPAPPPAPGWAAGVPQSSKRGIVRLWKRVRHASVEKGTS